jgi:hypothetical protein
MFLSTRLIDFGNINDMFLRAVTKDIHSIESLYRKKFADNNKANPPNN